MQVKDVTLQDVRIFGRFSNSYMLLPFGAATVHSSQVHCLVFNVRLATHSIILMIESLSPLRHRDPQNASFRIHQNLNTVTFR